MVVSVNAELVGAKELQRALRRLPKAASKAVLRKALKNAGKPIVTTAKANVPVARTGNLKRSIKAGTKLTRRQKRLNAKRGDVELFIGPTWPLGAHGHLVEFGTKRTTPRPFLRPAYESNKRRVLASLADDIWAELAKAANRLRRRAERGTLGRKTAEKLGGRFF